MAQMTDITVYNDAATPVAMLLKPAAHNPAPWIERDAAKSMNALARCVMNTDKPGKSGLARKLVKLEVPVMEQASGAAADGNVAPPKVAHVLVFHGVLYAHSRATSAQKADVTKMGVNILLGDATAGTGNAYKNAVNPARALLIYDEQPQ
jgi:hypothetical protein